MHRSRGIEPQDGLCDGLTAVLAAEAADLDILWGLRGPVEELKHHRGITHTFIAVPVVAGVVVGAVWLVDRWLEPATSSQGQGSDPEESACGAGALGLALCHCADRGTQPPDA